ncbi:MAG: hypothetical protein AAF739_03650 [Pseudomonadota bacterium]
MLAVRTFSFRLAVLLIALGAVCGPQPQANALPYWDRKVYIIDTQIVAHGPRRGTFRLANGMILDRLIEGFSQSHPLSVGDTVRLIFDDTRFLRRVVRLD